MKITENQKISAAELKKARKKRESSGSSFVDYLEEGEDAKSAGVVSGPAAMNTLLGLQEVGDATEEEKRQARQYGNELLAELEDVRVGLLMGGIPRQKLEKLTQTLTQQKKSIHDPRLREVILEIELRARVELAKYNRP